MQHRHAHPIARASIELALIGVAAHCVADVHCR
ncbi:Ms4533A family Cys-rich leader peptide [Actinacidiphila alni]|nr:Ms4533A family Cys-rich leader peptide [Actinacidiphila alni]